MKMELGPLKLEPGEAESFDFYFTPSESIEDCRLLTPVHAAGAMAYGGNEYLLDGKLTVKASFNCSRCLAPVEQDVSLEFDEQFDEEEYPGEDAVIDLEDVATQLLVTSIPMQALCRDDCKGLCPSCGKDLNEGECGCPKDDVDPRLEALRELLDK
ncbi:MAG: DUF177 domain-containing protein [Clostridiales bacterium]|nr:DUF177 domain-containing protein [Clostridiales bacterium]